MQQTQFMCLDWGRSLELKDCVREGQERKQQTLICDDLLNKLGVMEDATERQVCSLINACCCSPAISMMRQAVPGRQHSQNQHYKSQNQHSKVLNRLSKAQNQHRKAQNQHRKAQNQLTAELLVNNLAIKTQITCANPIELSYYAADLGRKDLCAYCGTQDAYTDAELKQKFKTVLPMCDPCMQEGKLPITQRPFGKKK
ncbi:hypothetical protein ACOMHN_032357 [Nucella lapillus]